jgi:hypothetical protein
MYTRIEPDGALQISLIVMLPGVIKHTESHAREGDVVHIILCSSSASSVLQASFDECQLREALATTEAWTNTQTEMA